MIFQQELLKWRPKLFTMATCRKKKKTKWAYLSILSSKLDIMFFYYLQNINGSINMTGYNSATS